MDASELLPEEAMEPPFTDDDFEAWQAWEEVDTLDENDEPLPIPPDVQRVVAWSVCDTGSAEWAMRRRAHLEVQAADINLSAKRFIDQIKAWEAKQLAPLERSINFFEGQLIAWARRRREEDGEKSLRLPSGEVTSRLNPARPVVEDEAAFIAWAKASCPSVVKAKWSPVMAEVRKLVTWVPTERGLVATFHDEIVPGVVQVPEEVTFVVKPVLP